MEWGFSFLTDPDSLKDAFIDGAYERLPPPGAFGQLDSGCGFVEDLSRGFNQVCGRCSAPTAGMVFILVLDFCIILFLNGFIDFY